MLDYFSREVEAGRDIVPNLQTAVNAVLAPSLAAGKLPKRKEGRPVDRYEQDRQRRIAAAVHSLRAQGVRMNEAVETVAQRESRDERTVYAHFRRHKGWVDRQVQRDRMVADYSAGAAPLLKAVFANLSDEDRHRSVAQGAEFLRQLGDDVPVFRRIRKLIDSD